MAASPVRAELVYPYPAVDAAVHGVRGGFGLACAWVAGAAGPVGIGDAAGRGHGARKRLPPAGLGRRDRRRAGPRGWRDAHHDHARRARRPLVAGRPTSLTAKRRTASGELAGAPLDFAQTFADVPPEDWGGTDGSARARRPRWADGGSLTAVRWQSGPRPNLAFLLFRSLWLSSLVSMAYVPLTSSTPSSSRLLVGGVGVFRPSITKSRMAPHQPERAAWAGATLRRSRCSSSPCRCGLWCAHDILA